MGWKGLDANGWIFPHGVDISGFALQLLLLYRDNIESSSQHLISNIVKHSLFISMVTGPHLAQPHHTSLTTGVSILEIEANAQNGCAPTELQRLPL